MTDRATGKFSVPLEADFDPQLLTGRSERVVVVAIIGKSRYNVHHTKASMLNTVIDNDIFHGSLHDDNHNHALGSSPCHIEGYYDAEEHVIYLHLISLYDTTTLARLCCHAHQIITTQGAAAFWQGVELVHARALLYLFSVSHILVLLHPGSSFDVKYVRFFRNLDTIRQKLLPSMNEVLRGMPISRDWVMAGRPCSPRVLFIFEGCTLEAPTDSETASLSKSRSQKTPPIKRLQHAIEDQVYRILRKARIITNISNNSLFAVPANQEFVFVHSYLNETRDPIGYFISQLSNNCSAAREADSPRSRSYQTNRRTNSSHASVVPAESMSAPSGGKSNSFREFLWQHIELALTKGFDDNVGRNPLPAVFELPSTEVWFDVAMVMYDFFMVDHTDTQTRPHFNTLKSLLEVDIRFSDGRCAKVLPLAESAYQENLPQHYTKSYHLNKLMAAKHVFTQHARGSAVDKYLAQLVDACDKMWLAGRQLCEEISLTGNHCVNPLHLVTDSIETDKPQPLPIMPHSSQVKTKAACNCGRKQCEREDPFDHRTANFTFYEKLAQPCCSKLELYTLPIFEPSTTEIKAAVAARSPTEGANMPLMTLTSTPTKSVIGRKDSTKLETGMSNLSLALSLGQSGGSDLFASEVKGSSFTAEGDISQSQVSQEQPPVAMETQESESGSTTGVLVRQHSTTEYLPGMLHSNSPPGLLPSFPSWSLVSLGKYSLYSPSQGLEQPGFLHSSNFLLPWDTAVGGDKEKWPVLGDSKKGKVRKVHKDSGESSIRIYVGNEYECPRGHRFFCSSPEKIFKAPPSGLIKETAHKLVSSEMPLYFPCHCRSSKGFMAQLMRVYVAVPEGPITVQLKPLVQPGPPPCPMFHPGSPTPITLAAGQVWVLRFPYVYLGEKGPYMMPTDPQQMAPCRLLRGLYQIVDSTAAAT